MRTVQKLSAFEQLVKQTVEAEFALRDLERPARKKLSAKAFVAEAIRNAGTTPEKVAALRKAIEANPAAFPNLARFLRRSAKAIAEQHMPSPPPSASHAYLGVLGRDEAAAELAVVGSHVMEAFAIAVENAAQQWPDAFGTATSSEGWKRDYAAALARRDEFRQRIPEDVTAADIDFGSLRPDGSTVPTLKISGGSVTLGPRENLGERVVNWVCGQADVLRALGVAPRA